MEPLANQKDQIQDGIFNDLKNEDPKLINYCMEKIMGHVDRNIEYVNDPVRVAQMLTIRWLINKNFKNKRLT